MKGKKNNRRKIFIFLIMILVGFVYLHFNGFSYPEILTSARHIP